MNNSLIQISDYVYSGLLSPEKLENLFENNKSFKTLVEYIENDTTGKFSSTIYKYLKNPDLYFEKIMIYSTEDTLEKALIDGVFIKGALFYLLLSRASKLFDLFVSNKYSIEGINLNSSLDSSIMMALNKIYIDKHGSEPTFFNRYLFEIGNAHVDIILEQDSDYIFKYLLANPETPLLLSKKEILTLALAKSWKLMNASNIVYMYNTFEASLVEEFIEFKLNPSNGKSILLRNYNIKDPDSYIKNKLNKFNNISTHINELSEHILRINNWDYRLKNLKSNEVLSPIDFDIHMHHVQAIIRFKYSFINSVSKYYKYDGFYWCTEPNKYNESKLFKSIFNAIAENDILPSCNKKLKKDKYDLLTSLAQKIKKNPEILDLNNYFKFLDSLYSNIQEQSEKAIKLAIFKILEDTPFNW